MVGCGWVNNKVFSSRSYVNTSVLNLVFKSLKKRALKKWCMMSRDIWWNKVNKNTWKDLWRQSSELDVMLKFSPPANYLNSIRHCLQFCLHIMKCCVMTLNRSCNLSNPIYPVLFSRNASQGCNYWCLKGGLFVNDFSCNFKSTEWNIKALDLKKSLNNFPLLTRCLPG